jgi:hypothetical protein
VNLGLCSNCHRFARPRAACPFCGAIVGAPRPRPKGRGTRSALVAATAAILACGGTIAGGDGGSDDAAVDSAHDSGADTFQFDLDSGFSKPDASDARMDVVLPPPPYGSPPVPDE